jgi:hypothetical protein
VVKKPVPDQLPDCVERERERELVETEVERSRVGCQERAGLEREREREVLREMWEGWG